MKRWNKLLVAALMTAAFLWAVTVNGSLQVLGTLTATVVDFTSSSSTAPMKAGTVLPGVCGVGQVFFKTDAAAGQNIHLCTAANTWTQVQGGGGGTFDWKPSTRYSLFRTEFAYRWDQSSPAVFGDWIFTRWAGSQNLNNPRGTLSGMNTGVLGISTSATANNRSVWAAETGGYASDAAGLYANTNQKWELMVIFRWPEDTDYLNSRMYVGMMSAGANDPQPGIGVRYLAGTDSALTFFTAPSASVWGSTVSSGVSPNTAWHRFRIRSDGAQTYRIWMSLDGGSEVSVCPSGCDLTISTTDSRQWTGAFLVNLATTAAEQKRFQLDYLHLWVDYGVER